MEHQQQKNISENSSFTGIDKSPHRSSKNEFSSLSHKTILQKTIAVGSSTLISKLLGIIREVLLVRYLGASGLSDAFVIANRIPNSLRKIFAEGALSSAFTPTIVHTIQHKGKNAVSHLNSLAFLIFEGLVLGICMSIMWYAESIISFLVPGFSAEQIAYTIPMLHILMPFILFISSSALLTSSLHATHHFFIPAIAQIVMNAFSIIGLALCIFFNLSVTYLCWITLFTGFIHFMLHLYAYNKCHFYFGRIMRSDFYPFLRILGKFLLCLPSVSLMEITLYIDTRFASYLKPGSISLFFYANRFVGIPLGVFAVAFSTILLPHFSRVHTKNPKRLPFYLLESAKFILWISMPVALLMAFFSEEIFSTIFLSDNFTYAQVQEASTILLAFLSGLFFFSLNKILLNIFYAMHNTWIPALITLIATISNTILNILFIEQLQAMGLALATALAACIQTVSFITILYTKYGFRIYGKSFLLFLSTYCLQLSIFSGFFLLAYTLGKQIIVSYMPTWWALFFTVKIGLWLWIGPLALLLVFLLYYSRKTFGLHLHFLK